MKLYFAFLLGALFSLATFAKSAYRPQFELYNKSQFIIEVVVSYGYPLPARPKIVSPDYSFAFALKPNAKYTLPALDANSVNLALLIKYKNSEAASSKVEKYSIYNINSTETVYLSFDTNEPVHLFPQTGRLKGILGKWGTSDSGFSLKGNIASDRIEFIIEGTLSK